MTFRLKLRATELDLPQGELAIGRGTECFLRIDDELVSRRHARLIVGPNNVIFEDLGSRNGSKVNGNAVHGSMELKVGDLVEIGLQTFRLLDGGRGVRSPTQTIPPVRECRACKSVMPMSSNICPSCGANQVMEIEDDTRSVSSFELLLGVGDKMLALGRTEDAERMLGPRLRDLSARAKKGEAFSSQDLRAAFVRGMRLAASTRRAEWFAWIFELARAAHYPLTEALLDELHAHMLSAKPTAAASALQSYLDQQTGTDPQTAVLRKRLEALMRFCRP